VSNTLEGNLLVALLVVASIGFPILTAFIARRKGYSFVLFFLFLFVCLIPAMITVMILRDRETGLRFGFGG
jgi:hypothetical protein